MATTDATVISVACDDGHRFSKPPVERIVLRAGWGVEGDSHAGVTVQHRSRVRRDPTQPNLRQVHLIASELFDEVAAKGFEVLPGQMGENVTTRGIDLLALPTGTILSLGDHARIEITGLRNPCSQIDRFEHGLLREMVGRDGDGEIIRKAGVMGIVLDGGQVAPGDAITVALPAEPRSALQPV